VNDLRADLSIPSTTRERISVDTNDASAERLVTERVAYAVQRAIKIRRNQLSKGGQPVRVLRQVQQP
jgi:hypothetical protein